MIAKVAIERCCGLEVATGSFHSISLLHHSLPAWPRILPIQRFTVSKCVGESILFVNESVSSVVPANQGATAVKVPIECFCCGLWISIAKTSSKSVTVRNIWYSND